MFDYSKSDVYKKALDSHKQKQAAIAFLLSVGFFIKVSDMELYHGRGEKGNEKSGPVKNVTSGKATEPWSIDPNGFIAGAFCLTKYLL